MARFSVYDEDDIMSGASNSTGAKATPPSDSPVPDSTSDWIRGRTVRHVGHHDAVQRVRRGMRDEEDRERYVLKVSGLRILFCVGINASC